MAESDSPSKFGKAGRSVKEASPISTAFVKYETFLKRFLRRFLSRPEDIEDVVQDTFLKAYSAEKGQKISSPKAFLFRIARNTALKHLSRKSHQIMQYIEDFESSEVYSKADCVEDLVLARERLGHFCQSALEMTPRCRQVFLLAKVYGFSYKEIATQLDISVSAVEKHVAMGLSVCNDYMERLAVDADSSESCGEISIGSSKKPSFKAGVSELGGSTRRREKS